MANSKKHVFIIGSKGIPAKYGGFESFVENLTKYKKSPDLVYHVSCIPSNEEYKTGKKEFRHNGAHCFNVVPRNIGPARAVVHDLEALRYCIKYIKKNKIQDAIVYILACRIGPFIHHYKRQLDSLGCKLYVNPDGHEWKRAKWSAPVRKYWKISEKYMVKNARLLVCDSKNIEKYIQKDYAQYKPKTIFIAYGSETKPSVLKDEDSKWTDWCQKKNVRPGEYYLVVGRFVPENNYETMVREFMKSHTEKDFVIITGVDNNKFYDRLKQETGFEKDKRIKFVGTVYDSELLKKIRENAFAYFHGHEVGGTNPSLLEALGSTNLNLLLDVGFNKEVAEDGALYWSKDKGNLAALIDRADQMPETVRKDMGKKAKDRILNWYSWDYIVGKYEKLFLRKTGV